MPKTKNLEAEIRARVEAFVDDLSVLVREAAVESVQDALGGTAVRAPRGRKKATTRRAPTRKKAGKRARRSTESVEAVGAAVLAHVKANPGQGVTEIATALRLSSKDLRLPILKLIADKKLRTTGQRRGTKYFAGARGGGRKKKATKRKASKKKRAKRTKR